MYIPGPSINITGTPRFVQRPLLFTEQKRIVRKPPKEESEDTPGLLCWGVVGDLPSANAVPEVSFDTQEYHMEISRETFRTQIFNPDDPEQYVEVDQTNKMTLKKDATSEKNNSATKDADLSGVDADKRDAVQKADDTPKGTTYTVEYKPPERAV